MDQTDLVTISNFNNGLTVLPVIVAKFEGAAKSNLVPQAIPTQMQFVGDAISVDCFGHLAKAVPRPVRLADGMFAMEYRFLVAGPANVDEDIELLRFYVKTNGRIAWGPDGSNEAFDYDNKRAVTEICGNLLLSAISSKLFAPTP